MKERWEYKKLGELFDITSSKRVFQSEWKTSGVPVSIIFSSFLNFRVSGFPSNEISLRVRAFWKCWWRVSGNRKPPEGGFKRVVTYTACPLGKLTRIVKTCFDTAKIQIISFPSKQISIYFIFFLKIFLSFKIISYLCTRVLANRRNTTLKKFSWASVEVPVWLCG